MRKLITFSVDAKGVRKELVGAGDDTKEHKKAFANAKHSTLPKGVAAVEQWELSRRTTGIDAAAQKRRLDEDAAAKKPEAPVPVEKPEVPPAE